MTNRSDTFYNQIINAVRKCSVAQYPHLDICPEVVERMLLEWLGNHAGVEETTPDEVDSFVRSRYPAVRDAVFAQWQSDCLHYCQSKIKDRETAEDMALEAITLLLTSKTAIHDIRFWLLRVCHNLVCHYYRDKAHCHEIVESLKSEQLVRDMVSSAAEIRDIEPELLARIPALVSSGICAQLTELMSYSSLSAYARAKGITYDRAKQTSKALKRDFRAICLQFLGWNSTPEILSYNNYKSIQRYLRRLKEINTPDSTLSRKNSLLADYGMLRDKLAGVKEFLSWNIQRLTSDTYEISLLGEDTSENPVFFFINIRIQPNGRIITMSLTQKEMIPFAEGKTVLDLPLEKGICHMSLSELKKQIEADTPPGEQFDPEYLLKQPPRIFYLTDNQTDTSE